jgi:hypothetical protein
MMIGAPIVVRLKNARSSGKPPGQLVVAPDHAITRARDDQGKRRHRKGDIRHPAIVQIKPRDSTLTLVVTPVLRELCHQYRPLSRFVTERRLVVVLAAFPHAMRTISLYSVTREMPNSAAASLSLCRCRSNVSSIARFSAASRAARGSHRFCAVQ